VLRGRKQCIKSNAPKQPGVARATWAVAMLAFALPYTSASADTTSNQGAARASNDAVAQAAAPTAASTVTVAQAAASHSSGATTPAASAPTPASATVVAQASSPAASTSVAQALVPPLTPPPPAANAEDKYQRIDALREPGLNTINPGTHDSILADMGGWRSALADKDMSLEMHSVISVMGDVLNTGQPRDPMLYNGQRFTVQTASTAATLSIGLSSLGLQNAMVLVGGVVFLNSANEINGANTAVFRELAYYQSYFNKAVEVKIGFMTNYFEYVGLFTGGSIVLAGGINGLIPIETGLSPDPTPTPAVNFTFHGSDGLYAKFGVQRSISPQGVNYEIQNNGIGFRFSQPGAGPLYIGEFGVKRPPSPDGHQIWLRAGAMYNDSDYQKFTGGTTSNHSVYVAGDYQLTQLSEALPYRGIYVGASAFWAPSNVNVYTQQYTARVYGIGLIDSRPADSISLQYTYNEFSKQAQNSYQMFGMDTNPSQYSIQASYSAHVTRGVYFIPGITYYKHPSFIGNFKGALLVSGMLYLQF
jgi:porin